VSLEHIKSVVKEAFISVLNEKDVATNVSFFYLGGHSLQAVQIVVNLRKHFACEVTLPEFLQAPTIDAFSQTIASKCPTL